MFYILYLLKCQRVDPAFLYGTIFGFPPLCLFAPDMQIAHSILYITLYIYILYTGIALSFCITCTHLYGKREALFRALVGLLKLNKR